MSTEPLDNDALATEAMLKMFENAASETETASTPSTEEEAALEHLELANIDSLSLDNEMLAQINSADDELPEISENNVTDVDILEVASDANDALSDLDISNDESVTLEADEASLDTTDETTMMPSTDNEPVAETMESHEEVLDEAVIPTPDQDGNETTDLVEDEAPIALDDTATSMVATPVAGEISAAVSPSDNIAGHLHAVVANAIQALQDWLELRQQSEEKGPQQNLAQLDVLLDTVTHQQQQLAEQLNNTKYEEINHIAQALGTTLATPETLGWSADTWRRKASEVAQKTDDISARNARLRQQLAQL